MGRFSSSPTISELQQARFERKAWRIKPSPATNKSSGILNRFEELYFELKRISCHQIHGRIGTRPHKKRYYVRSWKSKQYAALKIEALVSCQLDTNLLCISRFVL